MVTSLKQVTIMRMGKYTNSQEAMMVQHLTGMRPSMLSNSCRTMRSATTSTDTKAGASGKHTQITAAPSGPTWASKVPKLVAHIPFIWDQGHDVEYFGGSGIVAGGDCLLHLFFSAASISAVPFSVAIVFGTATLGAQQTK